MKQVSIVLGVIGSDCHAVGNKILERVFADGGFKVINLGVMVSQEEFIHAALETGAKAILVSSLYGQAELDCPGFRQRGTEAGLGDIILYVGGRLVIGKHNFRTVRKKFEAMGFDRVFAPDCDITEAVSLLKDDLAQRYGITVE
jgi:methylaspartate mutase sigma subunit